LRAKLIEVQTERDALQEQLATQKSYAGDLLLDRLAAERDITRLTEERDAARKQSKTNLDAYDSVVRCWREDQAERDALQERLRDVERERRIGDEQIVRVAKERDTAVQEAHESARQEVKASKCLKECCLQAKLILDTRDRIVIAGCAQRIVNLGEPASKGDE
jgi:hypothetical protein